MRHFWLFSTTVKLFLNSDASEIFFWILLQKFLMHQKIALNCQEAKFSKMKCLILKLHIRNNLLISLTAPLMALFTVPVIGHWSDICTSKWGRRRPFIFVLSLFLVLSLMLLCFGQNLVTDPERRHNG